MSSLVKRSYSLAGHRTSVALEPPFWSALELLAAQRHQSLLTLITAADADRPPATPLASRLRVLALENVRLGPRGPQL